MDNYKILCEKITPMKSEKIVSQKISIKKTSKKSSSKKAHSKHKDKFIPLKSELKSAGDKKTGK